MSIAPPLKFIDSHTGGEPTRLVLASGPDLGSGPLGERVQRFGAEHDAFRRAIVGEPRGYAAGMGVLLVEPYEAGCQFGLIFFNRAGFPALCGHGVIGVAATLVHLGRIKPGPVKFDTPAGPVAVTVQADGDISFDGVPSYRKHEAIELYLPGVGDVACDLSWGGNWFCLIENHDQKLELDNLVQLTSYCARIRQAVSDSGFPEVDNVALFGPATQPGASSRNFVLHADDGYDRSACGTAVCAKLAGLAADGKLAAGVEWVQEGILGSTLRAKYRKQGDKIIPTLTGKAHVMAEGTLVMDSADPFAWGIR